MVSLIYHLKFILFSKSWESHSQFELYTYARVNYTFMLGYVRSQLSVDVFIHKHFSSLLLKPYYPETQYLLPTCYFNSVFNSVTHPVKINLQHFSHFLTANLQYQRNSSKMQMGKEGCRALKLTNHNSVRKLTVLFYDKNCLEEHWHIVQMLLFPKTGWGLKNYLTKHEDDSYFLNEGLKKVF